MSKITIITPTYNRAKTLPKVFEALQNQSFKDFCWLILDDGSTDETEDIVKEFQEKTTFTISYKKNQNRHKFLTVLSGIEEVKSPYFMVMDSDDSYPEDALEFLFSEAEKITNQDDYIGIMGLSADEEGKIVGDAYPGNGFDGSILEMRHKYKVRGDKFGIFFTRSYHREINGKDYSHYEGKGYIPQSVIFNEYDAKGIKTRFVNKVVRFYLKDEDDAGSVSNTRWTGKNMFGLAEGHLSFLNAYGSQLFNYPKALIRNLVGYELYALKTGKNWKRIIEALRQPIIKCIGVILLPCVWILKNIK